MPTIVLHQWEMSPFCNKVRRCLRHKGLTFSVQNYNGIEARGAAKLSAVGTLPVMDYDGERIVDSAAIARFLDQRFPEPPLYPNDARSLARVHIWEDWAAQSLYFYEIYLRMLIPEAMEKALDLLCVGRPAYERPVVRLVLKRRYPKKLAAQGLGRFKPQEVERQLMAHLDNIGTIVGKTGWLEGEQMTIADIAVGAQIDEILRTSNLAPKILANTNVANWLTRLPSGR